MTNPIQYAALLLTHNCNLRCSYCYAGEKICYAGEKINRRMDSATALASLEFLKQHANGRTIVTFFGGEPPSSS